MIGGSMEQKVYSVDLASGATTTTNYVEILVPYKNLYLQIPTMASGSLYIKGSSDGTTFTRITEADPNQATDFVINSAVTQRMVPIPPGFRYYKIENTSGATDTTTVFKLIAW